MTRSPTASSTTAIAVSSRSARLRSDRIDYSLSRLRVRAGPLRHSHKFRKLLRHRPIPLASERPPEIGDPVEPLPAPLVEFRRLAVARRQRIDFVVGSGKAQREPFLALAAEFRQPVRGRDGEWRQFVSQPIGLAEISGARKPGLLPEVAHHRIAPILVGIEADVGSL